MASTPETVRIHYRRPPDREQLFDQRVVHREPGCVVTFVEHTPLSRPVHAGERVVLEAAAPVIWFTFPGRMHDIGRFHRTDGAFTGFYANILTPVEGIGTGVWKTTDLFLDVWLGDDGVLKLLDEDEFEAAVGRGWLHAAHAAAARAEATRLVEAARAGTWPPDVTREWTLQRVRAALDPPLPG